MTAVSDANDNVKVQPLEQHSPQLFNSLSKSDWQAFTAKTATASTGEPTSGQLSFDTDIYGQNLGKATASLSADEKALKSVPQDSSERTTDVAKLNTDEQTLRQDVFALKAAAPNFSDFSSPMQADKSQLTTVADGLWQMGLKSQAEETTAYYPLSHYADQFANKGTGSASDGNSGTVSDSNSGSGSTNTNTGTGSDSTSGSTNTNTGTGSDSTSGSTNTSTGSDSTNSGNSAGSDSGSTSGSTSGSVDSTTGSVGSPPPTGSTEISGLSTANQKSDTKAGDIGGSGDVSSISATQQGANNIAITMKGGSWGDGLLLNGVHNATTDQNVGQTLQLNKTFSFSQAQLNNLNEYENDIVNSKGVQGTQINVHTGEVDVWNAADSKWQDVGSFGGPLVAGKTYSLQVDAQDNANGTMTYTGYDIDGKNLISSPATFGDKPLGWAPGDYVQTQLDFLGNVPNGSTTGVTESDESLYVQNN